MRTLLRAKYKNRPYLSNNQEKLLQLLNQKVDLLLSSKTNITVNKNISSDKSLQKSNPIQLKFNVYSGRFYLNGVQFISKSPREYQLLLQFIRKYFNDNIYELAADRQDYKFSKVGICTAKELSAETKCDPDNIYTYIHRLRGTASSILEKIGIHITGDDFLCTVPGGGFRLNIEKVCVTIMFDKKQ